MDTSGKGGAVKHVVGQVNPAGVRIKGFGAPTPRSASTTSSGASRRSCRRAGDRRLRPQPLRGRAHRAGARPGAAQEWEARYDRINAWEQQLADDGVVLLKAMFHISPEYQRERLLKRIDDPTKHWKLDPSDVDERQHWTAYQLAYEVALQRCSTEVAPWHVVPADRKWYRNWALSHLLLETLRDLDLQWPGARARPRGDAPGPGRLRVGRVREGRAPTTARPPTGGTP
jgi:hypothetical protein